MTPVAENVPLSRLTSLHVGGPARYLVKATGPADVRHAVELAHQKQLPFFVLGKGSNTIFPDDGFGGVVILMEDRHLTVAESQVTAGAGVFMRGLVNFALQHNLRGLEELAGIPGTVGGAIRGNAGTWQTEIKDMLRHVTILDADNLATGPRALPAADCAFGYRDSIFKRQPNWIILQGTFALRPGEAGAGTALVQADMQRRRERQPYDAPSAGSIFKNPPGQSAGALLEQAGMKGQQVGSAEISSLHANWILNRGQATSSDIRQLIKQAQKAVWETSGVWLEPEIVIV